MSLLSLYPHFIFQCYFTHGSFQMIVCLMMGDFTLIKLLIQNFRNVFSSNQEARSQSKGFPEIDSNSPSQSEHRRWQGCKAVR